MRVLPASFISLALLTFLLPSAYAQSETSNCTTTAISHGIRLSDGTGVIDVEIIQSNIVRVDVQPNGERSDRTIVIDPALKAADPVAGAVHIQGNQAHINTAQLSVTVECMPQPSIAIADATEHKLIEQIHPLDSARGHRAIFLHDAHENLYGMSGLSMRENGGGLLRNNGSVVTAGQQGEGGAPWFFTTQYGVLIDSDDGTFNSRDNTVEFSNDSRKDCEYFVAVGRPMETMSALAFLTGRPPLPPKWTLGFLNSQWGCYRRGA